MIFLISGLIIFFGMHLFSSLRSREPGKDLRVRLGQGPYMGLYSVVALIGFVLIVYGYGAARPSEVIYQAPIWGQHVNLALMLPALILLVASQMPAGWIKKKAKHPMLLAVKIWAFGHLLANGELISVMLFASFLFYAVFARIMAKRRGDNGYTGEVKIIFDVVSIVIGVALYLGFVLWLHQILIGVPVIA